MKNSAGKPQAPTFCTSLSCWKYNTGTLYYYVRKWMTTYPTKLNCSKSKSLNVRFPHLPWFVEKIHGAFPEPTARALPRVCRIREIFSFHLSYIWTLSFFASLFLGYGVFADLLQFPCSSCIIATFFSLPRRSLPFFFFDPTTDSYSSTRA